MRGQIGEHELDHDEKRHQPVQWLRRRRITTIVQA
jgi:hypothetical protein